MGFLFPSSIQKMIDMNGTKKVWYDFAVSCCSLSLFSLLRPPSPAFLPEKEEEKRERVANIICETRPRRKDDIGGWINRGREKPRFPGWKKASTRFPGSFPKWHAFNTKRRGKSSSLQISLGGKAFCQSEGRESSGAGNRAGDVASRELLISFFAHSDDILSSFFLSSFGPPFSPGRCGFRPRPFVVGRGFLLSRNVSGFTQTWRAVNFCVWLCCTRV